MRKTLLTIGLVLSLVGLARVRADIFSKEDTIFSSPEMDGEIYILENIILQDTSLYVGSELKNIDVGDWVSLIPEYGQGAARGYISFNLTNLPESVKIQEATLKICQWKSAGDGVEGCFPVWDVPGGDTLFCILDHIDYGDSLDTLDWTAGDEGDPQTLHSNIGFISKDSIIGWKTLDVTQYIQADINSGRRRSQFRIRFPIQWDDDGETDILWFYSGDHPTNKPCLIINYELIGIEETKRNSPSNLNILNSSRGTVIYYSLPFCSWITLKIYDLSGREVVTLVNENKVEGNYMVIWNGKDKQGNSVNNGIYFCQLVTQNLKITKKIILIRNERK